MTFLLLFFKLRRGGGAKKHHKPAIVGLSALRRDIQSYSNFWSEFCMLPILSLILQISQVGVFTQSHLQTDTRGIALNKHAQTPLEPLMTPIGPLLCLFKL